MCVQAGPYTLESPAIISVADRVRSYLNRQLPTAGLLSMHAPYHDPELGYARQTSDVERLLESAQDAIVTLYAPRLAPATLPSKFAFVSGLNFQGAAAIHTR